MREKLNARHLTRADVPDPVALCVVDVSFISLTLILPPAFELLTPEGVIVSLIKPQFELRREDVGKGGIVRDPELHRRAVRKIEDFVRGLGKNWCSVIESPIPGHGRQQGVSRMSAKLIGLVAHSAKPGASALVKTLAAEFKKRGAVLKFEEKTAVLAGLASGATTAELGKKCDILLVLGGDGTILQVVHDLGKNIKPIFGINLGSLGFLTCVNSSAYMQAVDSILAGDYVLSQRTLIEVEVLRKGKIISESTGLNDAVISRGEHSRLIRLKTRIDNSVLTVYNADGLIVATATGSTAYSLSAGGPILMPDSGVFVITPICPHVLTSRTVIVSDSSRIEVSPCQDQDQIFLAVDGHEPVEVKCGDTIRISKSALTLPLAMLPGMSFSEVLRQKLKWSGSAV